MTGKKMTPEKVARMVLLRGRGYSQDEIGKDLEVSASTISYQLKRIRKLAEKYGPEKGFEYVIKGLILEKKR